MRFLFATFEGGGHVPPALLVARRLHARGHQVLFVSDEANRAEAESAGLNFATWRRAPNRQEAGQADDPLDDWRRRWPPAVVKAVCEAVICSPAGAYAADTLEFVAEFRPDLVVSNELLFGVMAACERAQTPLALLTANLWCFPTRDDLPPFGPGFAPARSASDARRDVLSRRWIWQWYDAGLAELNAARGALGLPPLARTLDQLSAARLVMLGTAQGFDFGDDPPPAPFAYAGPLAEAPGWVGRNPADEALLEQDRPNILVSFSTTFQNQGPVIARCIRALAGLPVRGIVTLGPALSPADLPSAPNVRVVAKASHDVLVPACAAMISHGGHGTVVRPLMHGVPCLVLPMGRDHADNAARIVGRGAGLRLSRGASAGNIRRALRRMLADESFARNAAALGLRLKAEADGGERAADAFESLAR